MVILEWVEVVKSLQNVFVAMQSFKLSPIEIREYKLKCCFYNSVFVYKVISIEMEAVSKIRTFLFITMFMYNSTCRK